MKKTPAIASDRNALELAEEAVHLLRTAPAGALAVYYTGAGPFVLGGLYFWADMTRSSLAPDHLAAAALGLAGLYFWMQWWQAAFQRRLRALVAQAPYRWPSPGAAWRIFTGQVIVQAGALFLLPLAAVAVVPFPRVYATFQGLTALADGAAATPGEQWRRAWRLAGLWPGQNILLTGVLALFSVGVWLNWFTVLLVLPELAKMFLGIESVFTRSPFALVNTTTLAITVGLTWLCVDPIMKAAHTLRCFRGESVQSGEDLKADLQRAARSVTGPAAALVLALALFAGLARAQAESAVPPAATPVPAATPAAARAISSPELDRVIASTLREDRYAWRLPRLAGPDQDTQDNLIVRFFTKAGDLFGRGLKRLYHWMGRLIRWLHPKSAAQPATAAGGGYGWVMLLQLLQYGLIALVELALGGLVRRVWRHRPQALPLAPVTPAVPMPDVADENVRADQLPEDGWLQLARELAARGEFRLALRAFHLATLAHLAARNLVSLARHKSNRDYERELGRRAHALPGLATRFAENVRALECVWYGRHPAGTETVDVFARNVELLRTEAPV